MAASPARALRDYSPSSMFRSIGLRDEAAIV
jgi:hypothetical protein